MIGYFLFKGYKDAIWANRSISFHFDPTESCETKQDFIEQYGDEEDYMDYLKESMRFHRIDGKASQEEDLILNLMIDGCFIDDESYDLETYRHEIEYREDYIQAFTKRKDII